MATGHKGLGKGLGSLFGEEIPEESGSVTRVSLRDIEPNPMQPRRNFDQESLAELAESIRENGLITPIAVRKTDEGYQIVAGERRWRACRLAGLNEIPVFIIEADDKLAFELAMIENLQRDNLNPMEEAEGYKALLERFGMTQEEIARRVGKSRPAVANALRLLGLPEPLMELVRNGELSQGHARTLLGLSRKETMLKAAETVLQCALSVRQTEKLVKKLEQLDQQEDEEVVPDEGQIYIDELEHRLAQVTGRKINISQGKEKGRITIEYYGNEDLESLTKVIFAMKKQ